MLISNGSFTLVVDPGCDSFPSHYSVSVDCAQPFDPFHNGDQCANDCQNVGLTVLTTMSAPLDAIFQSDTVTLAASDGRNVAVRHDLFCCHLSMLRLNGI